MAGQGQAPFALVYLGTVARDPQEMDEAMGLMLTYIYATLPNPPVYDDGARLSALAASPDAVDRISRLPDELLRNIVARLPVKDAARTTVLSSSWRALWPSTPLVLADGHLLPERQRWSPTPGISPSTAPAVSRILEAHPGPFRCVHLVCTNMNAHRAELARWLHLLAAKGVQDLVLVNRPWPRDVPLPAMLFAITTLTRLYVGMWKLPDTAARALCGASFPHLREIGVCCVDMEHGVLDSLVARSPVLEVLNILECVDGLRLRIVSKSLRCVQISCSIMETIAVVKAPRLERLIHSSPCGVARRLPTRIEIGDAPKLHVFGFLEPRQVLQIRDTIIMPGITSSTSTMVTSVKILSLSVRFEVRKEVKLVPAFLRCFPNVETLYIMSEKLDKPTATGDYLTLEFWEESGPIENIHSRISMMSFKDFTGDPAEVGFLEFFCRRAGALKTASIYLASPSFIPFSKDEAFAKVRYSSRNRASKSCKITVYGCNGPLKGEVWRFKDGADFSILDPFSTVDWRGSRWKP